MMNAILNGARRAGPYLLVELLLPGGSLIALLMLYAAYRKNHRQLKAIDSIKKRLIAAFPLSVIASSALAVDTGKPIEQLAIDRTLPEYQVGNRA